MPFTIFDPNMNKIDYPVGVTPLDFLVSAIEKERYIETVNGIPGNVNYGFDYKEREVTLNFWLRHYHGEHDQKLLKSELYAMLDSQPYFYVSDDRLPTRVLKLAVDEPYLPDRINGSNISTLEFKCQIIGLPFWRTKYTTQDIQNSGYSALVEKYGMADGININLPNYSFTDSTFSVWNGGNVTIDPRNMPLFIKMFYVKGTGTITNKTTGEIFKITEDWNNNHLTINGTKVIKSTSVNALRSTNRKFITLVPGKNEIEIKNLIFKKAEFDFPYYFK
ncbi:phage tail domain-containing protein [Staphylococcus hominis]|uniref:phage tail domain-containing protein n=1 Tax=Staphylococcus hominis TaxID=1290 RepID=UPI0011A98875|nr:phage tail domain-containing protein [Staphylococcus hominis]